MIHIYRTWPDSKRQQHIGYNIEVKAEDYDSHCHHRKWHWDRGWETLCCRCYAEKYWKSKGHVEGEVVHKAWKAKGGKMMGDVVFDDGEVENLLEGFWREGGPPR